MTNFERHFGWSAEKREGKDADQARRLYEILKETGREIKLAGNPSKTMLK
ncbi:MAG: hypothetical protein UW98_C0031G0002 [Parcubacteria group bacterium GW2011_GWC2_45_15]|nr:MAG: hypothetical protein UW98_C0031G0002 [Parcubacteria group bacterium GW2011_GWC2_45_15]